MSLEKLDIYSLRNILKVSINPSNKINLIVGKNASGKSSLLEAIYILGRAHSFRATTIKQVIQFDKNELVISGKVKQENSLINLGIKLNGSNSEIRINQENSNKAELAYSLPVLLIHPKSYMLIDAGPQLRREFLDWGVFNDEDDFLLNWRKFRKVLQQRNSLLKSKQVQHINVWDTELIQYGTIVSKYRQEYLEKLEPVFVKITQIFFDFQYVELKYLTGWNNLESFNQALVNDLNKDVKYGFTHSGPHRSDFRVLINKKLAKDYVSRGQLKLLMFALKLAQVKLLNTESNHSVCVLIDDLAAELDLTNKQKLLQYLVSLDCQVFMTTTEISNFGDLDQLNIYKVFHVEQGEIKCITDTSCST